MNIIKKFSLSALTLAMTLGLGACGNSSDPANNSTETGDATNTPAQTEEIKTATGDVPTVTYLTFGARPEDLDLMLEELNKVLDKEEAGYHVDMKYWSGTDYESKLHLAATTGEDWDLAFAANWLGKYENLVQNGTFMDITDLFQEHAKDLAEITPKEVIKGTTINGRLYAVPRPVDTMVAGDYFVWNKAYVEKYNIPIDEVLNTPDLKPYLEEVKEGEDAVDYPLGVAIDYPISTDEPQFVITSAIAARERADGSVEIYNRFNDEYVEQVMTMKEYMDSGLINPEAPQLDSTQRAVGDTFLVSKSEGVPGDEPVWEDQYSTEVVISPVGHYFPITNDKVTGAVIGVNSQSTQPELAMNFLNRMATNPEIMNLICYGVEGVNYEVVDGKVVMNEDRAYRVPIFSYLGGYGRLPLAGSIDPDDPELVARREEFIKNLVPSPTLGFYVDRAPIETELQNIEAVVSQYKNTISTGAFDKAYLDEFLEKLETAGIQTAIDEIQRQVDEWKANEN